METKLGINNECSGIVATPTLSKRISDNHLPEHSGKENGSRCRYVDEKKERIAMDMHGVRCASLSKRTEELLQTFPLWFLVRIDNFFY